MRKQLICLSILFSFLILCGFTYDEDKQRVLDYNGIYSEAELDKLESIAKEASIENKIDLIIHITNDLYGYTDIEAYTDDFYDYNGFGYNQKMGDGAVLVIYLNESNRKYHFSTTGTCVDNISSNEVSIIKSELEDKLKADEFYEGAEVFLDRVVDAYQKDIARAKRIPLYLLISLLLSGLIIYIMTRGQKAQMTVNARTYSDNIIENKHVARDRFVRTTTVRTKITKSSDNDSHTGSSGTSHGGGGGSF